MISFNGISKTNQQNTTHNEQDLEQCPLHRNERFDKASELDFNQSKTLCILRTCQFKIRMYTTVVYNIINRQAFIQIRYIAMCAVGLLRYIAMCSLRLIRYIAMCLAGLKSDRHCLNLTFALCLTMIFITLTCIFNFIRK